MLKTAVAIRHIHFEDLGTFEAVLSAAGYRIHYYDLGIHELWTLDPLLSDLLVVLGGLSGSMRRIPILSSSRNSGFEGKAGG